MSDQKPSLIAPLAGVIVGIGVFVGVNVTVGRAIVPTAETVSNRSWGLSEVKREVGEASVGTAPTGAYQTVCITCHQAEGQGMPGAFPPLAGSEWLTGDPETPIRIVLLGLSGAIEVKGTKFNAVMPPPPGMTDDKIAEAISYARSNFGNKAGAIDVALVKKVRDSLAGRTNPWSAEELSALRGSAPADGAAPAADAPAPAPGEGAAPAAPASPTGAAAPAAPTAQPAAPPAH